MVMPSFLCNRKESRLIQGELLSRSEAQQDWMISYIHKELGFLVLEKGDYNVERAKSTDDPCGVGSLD